MDGSVGQDNESGCQQGANGGRVIGTLHDGPNGYEGCNLTVFVNRR